jgi:hypothetical protein
VEAELDETGGRRQALAEHVGNVQQELQQSQAVIEERRREAEAERHLKTMGAGRPPSPSRSSLVAWR